MNKNTNQNIENKDGLQRPDIIAGDAVIQAVLPELDAAQDKLNELRGHLSQQHNNTAEKLFDLSHLKLSVAIENMADGVVMVNEKGTVEIANHVAKNLLGLPAECSLTTVKTAMENAGLKNLFLARSESMQKTEGEFMTKTSGGKILQMKWNAIIDSSKCFGGHVIVMRDTTAQVDLDRAHTEFIAAISHELRTPLTTMQNSISNMLAGVTGKVNAKATQYLNAMESDCHRLGRLINDLLDMAKLEAGKMHISRSATNLVDVAAKAVEAFSGCAAEKQLTVKLNVDGVISRVYVDSQRIYQVFANLITNAIKYTDNGGKISVSVFERADEVVTLIEDTGIGIAADQQHHIFNKFYQISRQAGPGYKGSGLGLSLSKEIVATHGGKMWVESELGKGSRFYCSLPKIEPKIVLHKHLNTLAERANKNGENFALMMVRLETSADYAEQNKQVMEAAMKQVMIAGDEITMASSDLIVRRGEYEAAIVVSQTGKRYLMHVKHKLQTAISEVLTDYRSNCGSVVPMLGIAVYPNDASTVEAIEKKAANELNRLV